MWIFNASDHARNWKNNYVNDHVGKKKKAKNKCFCTIEGGHSMVHDLIAEKLSRRAKNDLNDLVFYSFDSANHVESIEGKI